MRKNISQASRENVSGNLVFPIAVANEGPVEQDVLVAGPSYSKSPWVEISFLESLRASLKKHKNLWIQEFARRIPERTS